MARKLGIVVGPILVALVLVPGPAALAATTTSQRQRRAGSVHELGDDVEP